MSVGFKSSLTIFWAESSAYILFYAIFSLIVCTILGWLEFHQQSFSVSVHRIATKALSLVLASAVFFTLALYIVGWQARILGGELIALGVVTVLWVVSAYLINEALLEWSGLSFTNRRRYTVAPVVILVAPFVAFSVFISLLGSAWRN